VPNSNDGVKHFSNTEPVLLSEIVYDTLNINYEDFKALLKMGAIYVENRRQVKDKWILEESLFRVHTKPRRFNANHPWKSLIVFENDSFLVLNKPSGIPSHPSVDNAVEDSLTQVSLAIGTPLFVTHRIDTLTSGLIVYAKKKQFVKSFNIQMIERKVSKKYLAIVESVETLNGTLTHYMDPAPGTPKKLSLQAQRDWDVCKLEIIEQKKISSVLSQIKINLLTGRTHQIRAQMSALNAPILGDVLYGARFPFRENAIALRSNEIEFEFEGKKMKFKLSEDLNI
jgi:23S rRNA pseudouridine1911/1915/1917 synthase